jgi:hypothetical protein
MILLLMLSAPTMIAVTGCFVGYTVQTVFPRLRA